MKKTIGITAFVLLICSVVLAGSNSDIEKATVKIFTVTNVPDYSQPWQMLGEERNYGSGCIIDGNRILTNAHVVSDETFIQVLKNGETQKYEAEVVAVDHDCDLAILTVKNKYFFEGAPPVHIGGLPKMGDQVKVFGFPMGGDKLSITEGVVSRIEVSNYTHSYESFLTVQIDAAINPGNSGGPVISNGRLVGVAFQCYNSSQNIGYCVPSTIVRDFLKHVSGKKRVGFPTLGIITQNLENECFRKKLGMSDKQTGVVVNAVAYNSSAWDVLKVGDVILNMDGIKIANDGTVPFGELGRLDSSYIVKTKSEGDKLKMDLLRAGKPVKVVMTLRKEKQIIPASLYDVRPTYYIFGGVVFIPLNGNYLVQVWGDWSEHKQPANLMDHILNDLPTPDKQQIIIVRSILADASNIGYEYFRDSVVTKINGSPITDMKDLISKIENTKDKYLEIELENTNRIVLDVAKSKEASARIMARYKVESDRSEDLIAEKPAEPAATPKSGK
jgi:S1-C subfamily serine protease